MKLHRAVLKISILTLLILFGAQSGQAKSPKIKIELSIIDSYTTEPNKCPLRNSKLPYFSTNEVIPVKVIVANQSGEGILISDIFFNRNYCRNIKLIDPAGNLVLPKPIHRKKLNNGPHAPPLGYVLYKENLVRVAPCENLSSKEPLISQTKNLRRLYYMNLPGFYSAQVQVSAMVFNKNICDVDQYKWQGLLESEIKFFYFEGNTKIEVGPKIWNTVWLTEKKKNDVVVKLFFNSKGKITAKNIRYDTLILNGILKSYKHENAKDWITLFFDRKECIQSLGRPTENFSYPVILSGKLKNGQNFGGANTICLEGPGTIPRPSLIIN